MAKKEKYVFGPVPSRRLGLSLGVDIVQLKTCSLDCIYCQLGKTFEKTIERKAYVPIEEVLAELKARLAENMPVDFITIAGSGEPTLNSQLGEVIDRIKGITNTPVAILTNGTLLTDKTVRADCSRADVVIPSLDAGDEQTFEKINRPYKDITFEKLVTGLSAFRDEFDGQIWLEVFFVEGVNTSPEQIMKIKNVIEKVGPDKIQLNTAVRPTAETSIKQLDAEKLTNIAAQLGDKCEVIADFSGFQRHQEHPKNSAETVLSILKRRPCSVDDICSGLGISRREALKHIAYFQQQGVVDSEEKGGRTFFKAN